MIVGDTVRLEVNPEVSNVTSFTSAGDGVSNPVIAIRNAKTTFDIRNKQMLSIGGLMRNEKRETERRVPYLSAIPLLGWFFRSKRIENIQTQVVIFLTINILKDDGKDFVTQPGDTSEKILKEINKMKNSLPKNEESLENDKKLILDQK
jgi:type II secretory pathway component GspD/PulD (secretin)